MRAKIWFLADVLNDFLLGLVDEPCDELHFIATYPFPNQNDCV